MVQVETTTLKWWQRPTWLASLAAFIASISFSALMVVTIRDSETLDAIEKNQEGIDELVTFVRDLQSQPPSNGSSQVVQQVISLLCASEDPVRQQACNELNP